MRTVTQLDRADVGKEVGYGTVSDDEVDDRVGLSIQRIYVLAYGDGLGV